MHYRVLPVRESWFVSLIESGSVHLWPSESHIRLANSTGFFEDASLRGRRKDSSLAQFGIFFDMRSKWSFANSLSMQS